MLLPTTFIPNRLAAALYSLSSLVLNFTVTRSLHTPSTVGARRAASPVPAGENCSARNESLQGTTMAAMSGPPPPLAPEIQAIIREGIGLVLSRWSALRMAVENGWGGRSSHLIPDQIASDIFSWFTLSKEPLYIDDLENILLEGMLMLSTEVDDGSIEEVAEKLMIMHGECSEGNYSSVQTLREANVQPIARNARQVNSDSESGEDEEGMEEDSANVTVEASESQPNLMPGGNHREVPDAEGWTVVGSRRKGSGRS